MGDFVHNHMIFAATLRTEDQNLLHIVKFRSALATLPNRLPPPQESIDQS